MSRARPRGSRGSHRTSSGMGGPSRTPPPSAYLRSQYSRSPRIFLDAAAPSGPSRPRAFPHERTCARELVPPHPGLRDVVTGPRLPVVLLPHHVAGDVEAQELAVAPEEAEHLPVGGALRGEGAHTVSDAPHDTPQDLVLLEHHADRPPLPGDAQPLQAREEAPFFLAVVAPVDDGLAESQHALEEGDRDAVRAGLLEGPVHPVQEPLHETVFAPELRDRAHRLVSPFALTPW